MMLIGRRVIKPLHVIRDAMLRVAGGDLTAEASFPGRKDEIGALAGALAPSSRMPRTRRGSKRSSASAMLRRKPAKRP